MDNAYFNYRTSCAFVTVVNIMFISAKLAYFLISKEKRTGIINNVISFWWLLSDTKVFLNIIKEP